MSTQPEKKRFSLEGYIAAGLLFSLTILLSIQVLVRFLFGSGVSWSEEMSRYLFVWSIYFGCVLAAREDKHIRVTAQLNLLPARMRGWIITISDIAWILFSLIVTVFGLQFVLSMFEYPFYSQTMGFNLLWVYAIVPLAYALMTYFVIRLVIKRIRRLLKKEKIEIIDSRLNM